VNDPVRTASSSSPAQAEPPAGAAAGEPWVAALPVEAASHLAALRLEPGLTVLTGERMIWLQGPSLTDSLRRRLRTIPGLVLFTQADENTLWPVGSRLPAGRIPEGVWRPIPLLIEPELPPTGFAGSVEGRIPLRLVRGGVPGEAQLLQTSWSGWRTWAVSAPEVRLRPLAFAVADGGRTLIRGLPLPPVAGKQFVIHEGLAVPCGWQFDPPVTSAVIRQVLGLNSDELAVFDERSRFDVVRDDQFVQASRSAVRQTDRQLAEARQPDGGDHAP
jgi:hypothetical protein